MSGALRIMISASSCAMEPAFKHELLHFKGNDRFSVEFLEVLVAHNYSDSDEDDKKALVPVRLAARHLRMVSINRSAAESFVK